MWLVGSKGRAAVADVYVGTRRVLYVPARASKDGASQAAARSWAVADFAEALQVLDEQVLVQSDQQTTKGWRVWLSAGIARPFLLETPAKISSAEVRRIAQAVAAERTGIAEECELWIEPGQGAGGVVVVAVVKTQLQELLNRFAKGTGHRLRSLAPWWSEALRVALRRDADIRLIAVQDCDSLTWLTGQAKAFDGVQALSPIHDRATADAALARKRLAFDVDDGQIAEFRLGADPNTLQAEAAQTTDLALAPFVEKLA